MRKRESGVLVFSLSCLLFLGCIFFVSRSICSAVSSPALAMDIRVQLPVGGQVFINTLARF